MFFALPMYKISFVELSILYMPGFLGNNGGKAQKYCDYPIIVKSTVTAHIQEAHIFLGHFIFESVENALLKRKIK